MNCCKFLCCERRERGKEEVRGGREVKVNVLRVLSCLPFRRRDGTQFSLIIIAADEGRDCVAEVLVVLVLVKADEA